jgi:hypothetical protein
MTPCRGQRFLDTRRARSSCTFRTTTSRAPRAARRPCLSSGPSPAQPSPHLGPRSEEADASLGQPGDLLGMKMKVPRTGANGGQRLSGGYRRGCCPLYRGQEQGVGSVDVKTPGNEGEQGHCASARAPLESSSMRERKPSTLQTADRAGSRGNDGKPQSRRADQSPVALK